MGPNAGQRASTLYAGVRHVKGVPVDVQAAVDPHCGLRGWAVLAARQLAGDALAKLEIVACALVVLALTSNLPGTISQHLPRCCMSKRCLCDRPSGQATTRVAEHARLVSWIPSASSSSERT